MTWSPPVSLTSSLTLCSCPQHYWAWLRFWAFVLVVPATWKALPLDLLLLQISIPRSNLPKGLLWPLRWGLPHIILSFWSCLVLFRLWYLVPYEIAYWWADCLSSVSPLAWKLLATFVVIFFCICLPSAWNSVVAQWIIEWIDLGRYTLVGSRGPGCAVNWQCCDGMQICRCNCGAGTVQNILCNNVDKNFQPQESWRRK